MAEAAVWKPALLSRLEGFGKLTDRRQMGLLAASAGGLALLIVLLLWLLSPDYGVLYRGLADQEAAQIAESLRATDVPFRLDGPNGAILVPTDRLYETRLHLAGQGLPESSGTGFEMLERDPALGTSQFVETARYQHALEIELARSIASLDSVRAARVHLAMGRDSVFVRRREPASASVIVELKGTRQLGEAQVSAIRHLVSSSVVGLETDRVSIVDQAGNLLSENPVGSMSVTDRQFEYRQRVEQSLVRRIEALLTPVVGSGRVKAQVAAEIDFSAQESTREQYDPESRALRSEHGEQELRKGDPLPLGIPGALSNQPPGAGVAPPPPQPQQAGQDQEAGALAPVPPELPTETREAYTRNYEVSRLVSHVQEAPARVSRLSVAVVIDHRAAAGGEPGAGEPLPQEELDRLTGLVREAVGLQDSRGDSISVINAVFREAVGADLPEPGFWQQPWFWTLLRYLMVTTVAVLLLLLVVRPGVRALTAKPEAEEALPAPEAELEEDRLSLGAPGGAAAESGYGGGLPALPYEGTLARIHQHAQEDPRRVAAVLKQWLEANE